MNIKYKLGQMTIVRMHGKTISEDLISLIRDYHIGGISLYSNNYDSYEEMISLINSLKEINRKYNNTPLFITMDEEGGRVNRLPKDFLILPSSKKVSKDIRFVKESSNIIGNILKDIGVNMNFSPVLDIQRFEDNHAIGDRCFGNNKDDVTKNGLTVLNELRNIGIVPVIKHFPGHGLVKIDSHFFLPISKDIRNKEDIEPFISAFRKHAPVLMVSHIVVPKIDLFNPASLSRKMIKDYIRKELKYDGLIMTDDLKMKSVNLLYGYKRSYLKAVLSGNNLIVIGSDYNTVKKSIDYTISKLNKNMIKDIDLTYNKIISLKEKYNINDNSIKKIKIDSYNKRIEELRNNVKD